MATADETNCKAFPKQNDSCDDSSSDENVGIIFELTPPDLEFIGPRDICKRKLHKKKYAFYETINLYDYTNHYYFSKTPVLHLLDDLLGVDIVRNGDYYSTERTDLMLELELGHDDYDFLIKATDNCKKLLSSDLGMYPFTRSLLFRTWENKELAKIYLLEQGLKEDESTVKLLKEAINKNTRLKNVDIKIRGKCSGYYEESLREVSPGNTYCEPAFPPAPWKTLHHLIVYSVLLPLGSSLVRGEKLYSREFLEILWKEGRWSTSSLRKD